MLINKTNLLNTTTAFSTIFNSAFSAVTPSWNRVAMEVPSSTRTNDYRWLGKLKGMREWLGERELNNLEQFGYSITNKHFENTVEVDADDLKDDQIGVYSPMLSDLGQTAAEHPDVLTFGLLKNAHTTICYDGQNFADTDHPVTDAAGVVQSVSNYQAGAGEPWFLMVTKRAVKPVIFQNREKAQFVALDNPDDTAVFMKRQFLYGVDARWNVGFGLWQMCFMSRAALTPENYAAARAAILAFTGDGGRQLGLVPDLLVVGGTNEGAGRKILKNATLTGGGDNEWAGSAELFMTPYLTQGA